MCRQMTVILKRIRTDTKLNEKINKFQSFCFCSFGVWEKTDRSDFAILVGKYFGPKS